MNGEALNDPNKTGDESPQQGQHSGLGGALAAAGDTAVRLEHAAEQVIERSFAQHPRWRIATAILGWALVAAYFLFAGVFLGVRYWLLPNIGRYSDVIERSVSAAVGERVTVGAVQAGWQGLRPEINLSNVRIHDREGRVALSLPVIEAVVGWSSLIYGTVRFESLTLDRPDLEVRRDKEGILYVAGMRVSGDVNTPGFSDWLLAQRAVLIRDGRIAWDDEQRRAKRLELVGVNLLVRNSGDQHRFALRALVARELASALDVRGELRGGSLVQLKDWRGRLFAEIEYTDLAVWRQWIDYPIEVRSGQGGVRLWVDFAEHQVREVTADVALAGVSARLSSELPMLELDFLRGRLGAKQGRLEASRPLDILPGETKPREFQVTQDLFGRGLVLRTKGGTALAPSDFAVHREEAGAGKGARGEFTANALDLEPLAHIAEFLPFPAPFRKRLAETDPRGHLFDLKYTWDGDPEQPQKFAFRARFDGLSARANAGLPGFANLSGLAEATEKGGTLNVASKNVRLDLSDRVAVAQPVFDTLSGQVGWKHASGNLVLSFEQMAVANADFSGSLSGSYEVKPGTPGIIDLSGQFPRADARNGWRYIPNLSARTRQYLDESILGGRVSDVRLKIKGDLARFPFSEPKDGTFQVAGKFTGVDYIYAEGWPRVTAAAGDLLFEGARMQILSQRANVLGARAVNVRATVADLIHANEMLVVEGQAEGPTSEFLRFVDTSPVAKYAEGATQDVRATGNGRLQLRIDLPIRNLPAVRVAGNYQFQNNQVTIEEFPPLTQVNGRLDFSEAGIVPRGITAQFLGGPVSVSGQLRADGALVLAAQGSANMTAVRRSLDLPMLGQVSGSTPWRSNIIVRRRAIDVVVESNLQGVSIDLPPPFGKLAAEVLPVRIERSVSPDAEIFKRFASLRVPARGDVISVSAGRAPGRVNALLIRRGDGKSLSVDRGIVALNEAVTVPDRAGIVIAGNLPVLDVERWQAASGDNNAAAPSASSTSPSALAAINLKIGALDVSGKRFSDLSLRATAKGSQWSGTVEAREFAGEVQWRPEGRGRVQARLRHLTLPNDLPVAAGVVPSGTTAAPQRELPALDVVAEEFSLRDKKLGRLELLATNNEAREWRIDKLQLSTDDSTLSVDGIWQTWAARPSVNVNLKLEVNDAGKYLDRMGFAKVMQNGSARMEGKIGWAGSPQSIDFGTLTGNLSLTAERGQFLKADPGIAKLLGVLSLQSLVTLDLRDMFREGFSYDTLGGTATVSKGVLTTQDFRMKGASAQVNMRGTVDLARETQNLHMRVVPSVGDGASTITALLLANPAVGVIATLFQRLLKDPLGQAFSVEYDVTGTWNDPKVERTKIETPKDVPGSNQ